MADSSASSMMSPWPYHSAVGASFHPPAMEVEINLDEQLSAVGHLSAAITHEMLNPLRRAIWNLGLNAVEAMHHQGTPAIRAMIPPFETALPRSS